MYVDETQQAFSFAMQFPSQFPLYFWQQVTDADDAATS